MSVELVQCLSCGILCSYKYLHWKLKAVDSERTFLFLLSIFLCVYICIYIYVCVCVLALSLCGGTWLFLLCLAGLPAAVTCVVHGALPVMCRARCSSCHALCCWYVVVTFHILYLCQGWSMCRGDGEQHATCCGSPGGSQCYCQAGITSLSCSNKLLYSRRIVICSVVDY